MTGAHKLPVAAANAANVGIFAPVNLETPMSRSLSRTFPRLLAWGVIALTLALTSGACATRQAVQQKVVEDAEWCFERGGTFTWEDGSWGDTRVCEFPAVAPDSCYTTEDAPAGVPRDTNWYAYYLLSKDGAGAGGLDKYAACAQFPVTKPQPPASLPDE